MPPDAERWTKQIQETIADTSAVREGLTDEDAIPLIDWGIACAQFLGQQISATAPTEEQVGALGYALTRLMTRLTWLVTYRHKKDAVWLTRTFQMVNQLGKELYGDGAPVVPDEEIAAWIAGHAAQSDSDLLRGLISRLTPPALATPPTAADSAAPATPTTSAQPAPKPLTADLFPITPPAPTEPVDSQSHTPPGGNDDQTQ
ncbi:MAG: hypothetical protein HY866_18210 [Chloroflexi bacterium]|nr:hypothetical protein [Chloroflexota bacterium]